MRFVQSIDLFPPNDCRMVQPVRMSFDSIQREQKCPPIKYIYLFILISRRNEHNFSIN